MALSVGHVSTLNNAAILLSSSRFSLSRCRDIDLALAAQQSSSARLSRGACNEASRLVVRAVSANARSKKIEKKTAESHVEHHYDGEDKPQLPAELNLKWLNTNGELKGLKMEELALGGHGLLLGSRIPKHYFLARGFGETDRGDGSDPWETGSYDLALEDAVDDFDKIQLGVTDVTFDVTKLLFQINLAEFGLRHDQYRGRGTVWAGIQDLNVIKYTSVIPPEAEAISALQAKPFLRHGAVMESIMSVMHGVKGDRITAGVARAQIRRKKDNFHIGGYAAEYEGHASATMAKNILKKDLDGIFGRRFDENEYEIFEEDFIIEEGEITKSFGSVLASICFVTYVLPAYSH